MTLGDLLQLAAGTLPLWRPPIGSHRAAEEGIA